MSSRRRYRTLNSACSTRFEIGFATQASILSFTCQFSAHDFILKTHLVKTSSWVGLEKCLTKATLQDVLDLALHLSPQKIRCFMQATLMLNSSAKCQLICQEAEILLFHKPRAILSSFLCRKFNIYRKKSRDLRRDFYPWPIQITPQKGSLVCLPGLSNILPCFYFTEIRVHFTVVENTTK